MLLVDQGLEQLGHGQGLQLLIGLDQNTAVGADGHGRAQGFLALGHAAGNGDDFGHDTLFLQAHGLLDGDFVEGVHAHLDVGDVHTRVVRFDADLYVVVHHALDGDQYLHCCGSLLRLSVDQIIQAQPAPALSRDPITSDNTRSERNSFSVCYIKTILCRNAEVAYPAHKSASTRTWASTLRASALSA